MDDPLKDIQLALPPYLGAETKRQLLEQLRGFPKSTDFYTATQPDPEALQGDAWHGLVLIDFETGTREAVLGMVLSNSCDITDANEPDPDQMIVFAPLIDLHAYADALLKAGKTQQQVGDILADIRKQGVHRLFYLPEAHGQFGESIVPLDSIHSQPLQAMKALAKRRAFSLSTYGWYVLLVKLSIHFTRMQENVKR